MSNVLTQNWKENGKAVKGLNQASQDHRVMQHDHHLSTQKIKMLFRMGPPCTSTQSIWVGVPIDHKSLNRMELSGFVYELLHFLLIWAPPVWGWGWVDGMWVYGGALCIHTHTHTHTHTHIHVKSDNFNCKWLPPLANPWGIPMYTWGTLPLTPQIWWMSKH